MPEEAPEADAKKHKKETTKGEGRTGKKATRCSFMRVKSPEEVLSTPLIPSHPMPCLATAARTKLEAYNWACTHMHVRAHIPRLPCSRTQIEKSWLEKRKDATFDFKRSSPPPPPPQNSGISYALSFDGPSSLSSIYFFVDEYSCFFNFFVYLFIYFFTHFIFAGMLRKSQSARRRNAKMMVGRKR